MTISPEFLDSDLPSSVQKYLLVLLALFVPPLPIYLLSGPRHSFGTKEFIICCVLTILFFVVGVFYSLIFILSTFPNARLEAGRDGYLRVGDAEAEISRQQEISHQSGDIQHRVTGEYPAQQSTLPYEDNPTTQAEGDVKPQAKETLLPSYEESEGNSNNDSRHKMTKFDDNKVQH